MVWSVKRPWFGRIDEFDHIEAWFGTEDPEELLGRYDRALEMLGTGDVETWLNHSIEAGVSTGDLEHFNNDWLDGDDVAASRDQITTALHTGFTNALTDARDNGLRTAIVYIQHGDEFAVDHVVGGNGVTVVICVPEGTVPNAAYKTQS